ncbi:MAG: fibronectin type III domain-containing protein [Actinomycetota bacterium]
MTKVFLIVIAGVLALNVALLGGAAMVAVLDRRRRRRDIRELETLWQMAPRRPTVSAGGARSVRTAIASRATTAPPRATSGHRLVGVTLVAALAFVGTASASPRAREVVASVLTTVTQGLGLDAEQPGDERAPDVSALAAAAQPANASVREIASPSSGARGGTEHSSPSSGPPAGAGESTIVDPGVVAPPATTVTAAGVSSSVVEVRWEDVAGEKAYRLERSVDGDAGWTTVTPVEQNLTSAFDTGLTADTNYFYRVITITRGGDGAISDVASATTWIAVADTPTVVAVAVSSSEIDLSWSDVGTESGYRVERSVDGSMWIELATTAQDVTAFNDTGLLSGTAYSYRVVATNAAGDSAPSELVGATTASDAVAIPADPPETAPAG